MVEIIDQTRSYPQVARLEAALQAFMAEVGAEERELTLILADDAYIRKLNRRHRGVDAPTDVLSYPTHEPDDTGIPDIPHLGDIFISIETAARQAPEHGLTAEQEVGVLAAHGFTHLLGYDHQTEDAWQVFEKAQGRMLELMTTD
ncbi:MAG TPA: rRNA maturation RNase YbeY [Trueperaceae bacterium]